MTEDEDLDMWCTKCGSKDPDHLREVVKYMGCRAGEVKA